MDIGGWTGWAIVKADAGGKVKTRALCAATLMLIMAGCSGEKVAPPSAEAANNQAVVEVPNVPDNQVFNTNAPVIANIVAGNAAENTVAPANPLEKESFVASGNEPFWSISVEEKRGKLTTPEDQKGAWFPVQREVSEGKVTITGLLNGKPLTLTIEQRPCQDDMSGANFPFTSTLRATLNDLPGSWSGCARRLSDPMPKPQ